MKYVICAHRCSLPDMQTYYIAMMGDCGCAPCTRLVNISSTSHIGLQVSLASGTDRLAGAPAKCMTGNFIVRIMSSDFVEELSSLFKLFEP